MIFLTQAAKYIEYDTSFGDEEKKQAKALKVTCNLNNAACKLKLKDYKQAEKLCTKVKLLIFKKHTYLTMYGLSLFLCFKKLTVRWCAGFGN